jgi:predicted aspartyl protease
VHGGFDQSGSPTIDVEVSGPLQQFHSFTAIMDTGFTGFLLLPIASAFPIGLLLHGIMPIQLADGSVQTKLTCRGQIRFDSETREGIVVIEDVQSTEVLVGMDFLKRFRKQLIVDPANGITRIINAPAQGTTPIPLPTPPQRPH